MNQPLVSVVMVVCNVERCLREAIESILAQTYGNFEFVIVDFGSTDSSKAIVASYAAQDRRILLQEIPHCGLAEARNAACTLARGEYLAIMDADDIALPERLAQEVAFMEKHPQISLLGGGTEWIDSAGRSLCVNYFPSEDSEIKAGLVHSCTFCQPTVLVRTDIFRKLGGYRKPFAPSEDYDLWLRISEQAGCANLKQVLLKYRIHPSQVTQSKQRQQTLCKLAAQNSAAFRKMGKPDPFLGVQEITPQLLAGLGVTPAQQENAVAKDCRNWIRSMRMAGEISAALQAALQILRKAASVERWQIADLHFTVASLYWEQGRFFKSVLAAARALIAKPVLVFRPLKSLVERWTAVRFEQHPAR